MTQTRERVTTIALDAMGGDHAPGELVKGALQYAREDGSGRVVLVGRGAEIRPLLGSEGRDLEIVEAPDVVAMHEHPAAALRRRSGTSIGIATQLVRNGDADAVVSAGNTGAQMASAVLVLGRIANIDRPALCGLIPTASGHPLCLLDIGATVDTDARNLLQFAMMGSLFMERVHGVKRPSVGLLNVGEESGKGSRVLQEAQDLLRRSGLNYFGNVEGRDIVEGSVHVIVCDGFVGNAVIKALEGLLDMMRASIRDDVFGGPVGKVAAVLASPGIARLRRRLDYDVIGGVPLLGVDGVSVVTHGRARARMIRYAIEAAVRTVRSGLVGAIGAGLAEAEAARP